VAWTGAAALGSRADRPVEFGVPASWRWASPLFQGLPDAVGRLPVSLAS
jgi:hypothetical protein